MIRKTDDGFQECRKKKIPAKIRQGRKVMNPIKCRHCGKIFHDASNRRKHENNRVCSAGKAKHDLIKCIGSHFENVYALLVDVYADIAKHMESVLGKAIFEENKIYRQFAIFFEYVTLFRRSFSDWIVLSEAFSNSTNHERSWLHVIVTWYHRVYKFAKIGWEVVGEVSADETRRPLLMRYKVLAS